MNRRSLALVLVFLVAFPPAALATPDGPSEGGRSSFLGGSLFWGAFALLNGAILASSIVDMQFYESRAEELEATGEDAGDYWDASSREKVMIGLSGASLLLSLAAWKSSLGSDRAEEPRIVPLASAPPAPGAESGVTVLSHEGRIRYDTLLTAPPPAPLERFETSGFSKSPGETGREAELPAPKEETIAAKLPEGEEAVSLRDLGRADDVFTETGVGPKPSSPLDAPAPADDLDRLLEYLREERSRQEKPADPAPAAPAKEAGPSAGSDPGGNGVGAEGGKTPGAPRPEAPREETGTATFTLQPYGVHVSSYRTMALAEKDEALWSGRGYRVVIEEDQIPEKGIWYRVFLGNFESWSEAAGFAADLKNRHGLDYAQAKKRSGY